MSELVVILQDLFPPLPPTASALSRLAALETLLARARREPLTEDWRVWLAARMGAAKLTPAAILSHAWGVAADAVAAGTAASERERGRWLATPVHLVAGMDRILLHPAGLLSLPSTEQQRLVDEFSQVFAGSAWQLHARGQRELLLIGPPVAASGSDPARFLGTDPSAGLPHGPEAAPLRSLGSELELWLHEHPLNYDREQRAELSITTLWLWGGRDAAAASLAATVPQRTSTSGPLYLYGSDTCAVALARALGGTPLPLPAEFAGTAALKEPARSVVLYSLYAGPSDQTRLGEAAAGRAPRLERLERLEQRWLAPALASLRAGRLQRLLLVAADHVYHLDRPGSWRLWRTRAPWWEEFA